MLLLEEDYFFTRRQFGLTWMGHPRMRWAVLGIIFSMHVPLKHDLMLLNTYTI